MRAQLLVTSFFATLIGCAADQDPFEAYICDPAKMTLAHPPDHWSAIEVEDGTVVIADGAAGTDGYHHCLLQIGLNEVALYERDLLPPDQARMKAMVPYTVAAKVQRRPALGEKDVTVVDAKGRRKIPVAPAQKVGFVQRHPVAPISAGDARNEEVLALELTPTTSVYRVNEPIDVRVTFHNRGTTELKIPFIEGGGNILFFDFVLIEENGPANVISNSGAWDNPNVKPVKLIAIGPGEQKAVLLREAFTLNKRATDGVHSRKIRVIAMYKDYAYGHSPTYPEFNQKTGQPFWKGAVASPVTLFEVKGE